MENLWESIKEQWYKLLSHLASVVLMIIKMTNTDYSITNNITIDTLLSLSIVISIGFTFNIVLNYRKTKIVLKQKNKTIINYEEEVNNYKTSIKTLEVVNEKYELQIRTLNVNNISLKNVERPELAFDLVNYTHNVNYAGLEPVGSGFEFVDPNQQEIQGSTYYIVINDEKINIDVNKQKKLAEYMDSPLEFIDIKNGRALVEKPRRFISFKIINIGKKAAIAFYPEVETDKSRITGNGILPRLLHPNDEVLFLVLIEYIGSRKRDYTFKFTYTYEGEEYIQQCYAILSGKDLTHTIVLTNPVRKTPPPLIEE